jgi:hypothetical protein
MRILQEPDAPLPMPVGYAAIARDTQGAAVTPGGPVWIGEVKQPRPSGRNHMNISDLFGGILMLIVATLFAHHGKGEDFHLSSSSLPF